MLTSKYMLERYHCTVSKWCFKFIDITSHPELPGKFRFEILREEGKGSRLNFTIVNCVKYKVCKPGKNKNWRTIKLGKTAFFYVLLLLCKVIWILRIELESNLMFPRNILFILITNNTSKSNPYPSHSTVEYFLFLKGDKL